MWGKSGAGWEGGRDLRIDCSGLNRLQLYTLTPDSGLGDWTGVVNVNGRYWLWLIYGFAAQQHTFLPKVGWPVSKMLMGGIACVCSFIPRAWYLQWVNWPCYILGLSTSKMPVKKSGLFPEIPWSIITSQLFIYASVLPLSHLIPSVARCFFFPPFPFVCVFSSSNPFTALAE